MVTARTGHLRTAQRIFVYGVSGSGKSTAARQLGALRDLPVHDIDDEVRWLPGWVPRDLAEQRRLGLAILGEPQWVIDSMISPCRDEVLQHVELVVALDYPRWFTFRRLLRRTVRRIVTRELVCNGNVESVRQMFSSNSILMWHAQTAQRRHRQIVAWEQDPSAPPVLRLQDPADLARLLAEL